jgi:hypothetical protein
MSGRLKKESLQEHHYANQALHSSFCRAEIHALVSRRKTTVDKDRD